MQLDTRVVPLIGYACAFAATSDKNSVRRETHVRQFEPSAAGRCTTTIRDMSVRMPFSIGVGSFAELDAKLQDGWREAKQVAQAAKEAPAP
jgi:hypothetical protein